MKKVCKTVFCVIAILLIGFFSQQETKAGETSERRYSRAYSVLSANVGSASLSEIGRRFKLRLHSDEEKKVKEGIKNLKPNPDIMVLIEVSDKDQVKRICDFTAESYFICGGDYDFICVKNDIIAKKGNGKQDIKHVPMPEDGSYEKYKGNSVGYVDVGLKDEGGRKVRLFYAHFPSPQLKFSHEENVAHINAFGWIEVMLIRAVSSGMPCLIGGDLNNDFIRQRNDASIWSAKHIYEQVAKRNLWIFNSPPDGGLKDNYYEGTYRVEEEALLQRTSTIDWVMGKDAVPPSRIPGAKPSSGGWTEGDRSFVTNPPNWWKGSGFGDISWLTFDHKPLYGKVVFFWEERVRPAVKDWKEYKLGAVSFSVPSDWSASEVKNSFGAMSPGWIEDKKYSTFSVKVMDFSRVKFTVKPEKWSLIHIGTDGGKKIVERKATTVLFRIIHLGKLVDSFKIEITGQPVMVCILEAPERIYRSVEGFKFFNWSFVLFEGGKKYAFHLISTDHEAIFKQLVSRIHLSPEKD